MIATLLLAACLASPSHPAEALPAPAGAAQRVDFAKKYPSELTWSESGLDWVSEADDAWELSEFRITRGKDLDIACKRATVVFGRHGTSVLWAAVFPDEPVKLRARLAGDGEEVDEIFVRLAPKDIGKVFPAKSVRGQGDASLRARAARLFQSKIGWKWSTPAGNSTVVPIDHLIVDMDTDAGKRRMFYLPPGTRAEYVAEFETRTMTPLVPIDAERAAEIFASVWDAFASEYAGFARHPKLDWKARGVAYEARARRARTTLDLAATISDGLAALEDLHVDVQVDGRRVPGYSRPRQFNANPAAHEVLVGTLEHRHGVSFARTGDGIGFLAITSLTGESLDAVVDAALEELRSTWALIVDLRANGGGDEMLGLRIAGRFVDDEAVYARNRYRAGPGLDELGPFLERRVTPREWRYARPVWVLQGQRTLSSAESLVSMLATAPNVVTAGSNTGGSSGNPRSMTFDGGIAVSVPRWLDMTAEGKPIEGVGIPPKERIEFADAAFTERRDPVLAEVLARLRRTPKGERVPARP